MNIHRLTEGNRSKLSGPVREYGGDMPRKKLTNRVRLNKEMRSEALLLFRVADSVKAKRKMIKKWNSFHAVFKVSLASLYRWDRLIRMNMAAPIGGC